jgi:hypothetical protein
VVFDFARVKLISGLAEFARIIVTEFDATVIGSIFGFWFVDRALRGKAVRGDDRCG